MNEVIIQGHRGCMAMVPENSIEGVCAAFATGAFAVEIDVWLSSDLQPVVVHDPVLSDDEYCLTAGWSRNTVFAQTAQELQKVKFGDPRVRRFSHLPQNTALCQLPTLGELLEHPGVQPDRINIELKSVPEKDGVFQPPPHLYAEVFCEWMVSRGLLPWRIQSFDHRLLNAVLDRHPNWPVHALLNEDWKLTDGFNTLHESIALPAQKSLNRGWCVNASQVSQALVDEAEACNMHLSVYGVNDPATFERLLAMGLTDVISDDPKELLAQLENPTH